MITTAELEEIRAADAAMGEGPDALQLWPVVYTQRRGLLEHSDALQETLTTLAGRLSTPNAWALPDGTITFDENFRPAPGSGCKPLRIEEIPQ